MAHSNRALSPLEMKAQDQVADTTGILTEESHNPPNNTWS